MPSKCPKCQIDPCENCPVNGHSSVNELSDKYCIITDLDYLSLLDEEEFKKYLIKLYIYNGNVINRYNMAMTNQIILNNKERCQRCPGEDCDNIIYK